MALSDHRVFRCRYCGHALRFGAPVCGSCYQPTQVSNRVSTWVVALLVLLLGISMILLGLHVF